MEWILTNYHTDWGFDGYITNNRDEIIHREMDTESENPSVEIAEIVAELEEKDVIEVTTIWECVDGMLAEMFANPPSPEAQLEVTFS